MPGLQKCRVDRVSRVEVYSFCWVATVIGLRFIVCIGSMLLIGFRGFIQAWFRPTHRKLSLEEMLMLSPGRIIFWDASGGLGLLRA